MFRVFGWQAAVSAATVLGTDFVVRHLPRGWNEAATVCVMVLLPTLALAAAAAFCVVLHRRGERGVDLVPAAILGLIVAGGVLVTVYVVTVLVIFVVTL